MLDLQEIFQDIQKTGKPELLQTASGTYIYSPFKGDLQLLPPVPQKPPVESRSVSTIESLVAVALEELARADNNTGRGMTVIFDLKGATLFINDESQHLQWRYQRCLSQQWEWLINYADKTMTHRQFVRAIQGLKPSITNYSDIFRAIRRVNVSDSAELVSAPIIEEGSLGESLSFNLKVEGGGSTKAAIPTEIPLEMTFARGGEKRYSFNIGLDIERVKHDAYFTAGFVLNFLEKPVIEDLAIADEVAFFTEQTKEKPDILKVLDY